MMILSKIEKYREAVNLWLPTHLSVSGILIKQSTYALKSWAENNWTEYFFV